MSATGRARGASLLKDWCGGWAGSRSWEWNLQPSASQPHALATRPCQHGTNYMLSITARFAPYRDILARFTLWGSFYLSDFLIWPIGPGCGKWNWTRLIMISQAAKHCMFTKSLFLHSWVHCQIYCSQQWVKYRDEWKICYFRFSIHMWKSIKMK